MTSMTIRQDENVGAPSEMTLSRSSPEPLYRQLAAQIEAAIRGGALKPGERLDSEATLSERFAVSRITVRQAIEALVRKQIVVRKQGKGTFVTQAPVRHDLRRVHGLLGSLFAQSESAGTRLLRYELAAPPRAVAQLLALRRGAQALAVDRLYLIGGRAVALARVWLVPEVGALPRTKADLISTEDMMRAAGIRIARAQVSIRAEAAGATVGRLLRLPARAPVLVLRRDAIGADGAVKETGCVWLCSEAYELVCSENPGPAEKMLDIRNVEERL